MAFSNSIVSPLATHLAEYPEDNTLIPHGQALTRLLACLGIEEEVLKLRRASLPLSTPKAIREVEQILSVPSLAHTRYVVFHMGSGVRAKELPNSFWRELAELLSPTTRIIFTGKGAAEPTNISQVIQGLPNCFDASNKLSWDGFVAAIRYAQVVYTVDTMAGHVAGAVSTGCVAMFGGNNGVGRWRPDGDSVTIWSYAMECAPCRNMQGCADMKCMQGFSPTLIQRRYLRASLCHLGNSCGSPSSFSAFNQIFTSPKNGPVSSVFGRCLLLNLSIPLNSDDHVRHTIEE